MFAVIISIIYYENALSSSIPKTLESCITISILKMIKGGLSRAGGGGGTVKQLL